MQYTVGGVQIISALATLALVWLTYQHVNATRETVSEMKAAREVQERPYIIVDVETPRGWIIAVKAENVGNGAAKDVRFKFDPPMVSSQGYNLSEVGLFKQGLDFFPAGKQISTFFDSAPAYFKDDTRPVVFDVAISYADATEDRKYESTIRLDLSAYKELRFLGEKGMRELVEEIGRLRDEIGRIAGG